MDHKLLASPPVVDHLGPFVSVAYPSNSSGYTVDPSLDNALVVSGTFSGGVLTPLPDTISSVSPDGSSVPDAPEPIVVDDSDDVSMEVPSNEHTSHSPVDASVDSAVPLTATAGL